MTIINLIDSSLALRSTAARLHAYLDGCPPDERDEILRLARTPRADRTDADRARIADLAERLSADDSPAAPTGDVASRLAALEDRIERYRREFPTTKDEINRLSAIALSENLTASNLSPSDQTEVDRLVAVAQKMNGTAKDPDPPDATTSDDAEVARLAAVARGLR